MARFFRGAGLILIVLVFGFFGVVAFSDTTDTAPNNNSVAPLNIGSVRQVKNGNLEVGDLRGRNGITLGGVRRTGWPGIESGVGCNWEGTACRCVEDDSTGLSVAILSYKTCKAGVLTESGDFYLNVTTGRAQCAASDKRCTAGLYQYKNFGSGDNLLERVVDSIVGGIKDGAKAVVKVVSKVVKALCFWC